MSLSFNDKFSKIDLNSTQCFRFDAKDLIKTIIRSIIEKKLSSKGSYFSLVLFSDMAWLPEFHGDRVCRTQGGEVVAMSQQTSTDPVKICEFD